MRKFLIIVNVLLLMLLMAAGFIFFRGIHIDEKVVFLPITRPDRTALDFRGEERLNALVRHERLALGTETIAISSVGSDTDPLIISCFGNASDRYEHGVDYASKIIPFGQALLWDYPGYGDSTGQARVETLEAVIADFIPEIEKRRAGRPLILWGHSLGGFVCSNIASQLSSIDGLILETTASNIQSVAKAWTPSALPIRVSYDEDLRRFDVPAALDQMSAPVLIIGAGRDRVLPVGLSQELSEALPDATYLELPEATHFSAGFDPRAQAAIAEMIDSISR